jgi:EpsI family protein
MSVKIVLRRQLILLSLILISALMAWWMRPRVFMTELHPPPKLEKIIPLQFGKWKLLPQSSRQIVNPQTTEKLNKIYSQTLSRSYINDQGRIVMLSIAYSANQSDSLALHYPEACYPAQGFEMKSLGKEEFNINNSVLPVQKLLAKFSGRVEPIIYWTTLGNIAVRRGIDTKLLSLQYGLKGQVPDGLLFRISSITTNPEEGYKLQREFVDDLIESIPNSDREFFIGIKAN